MGQRMVAACIAAPLALALLVLTAAVRVPYSVYSPGSTLDVLGTYDGEDVVEVSGRKVFPPEGTLRMTTVEVTRRRQHVSLMNAVFAWADSDRVVVPLDVAHLPTVTEEQDQLEGAIQMVSSQDVAVAVALKEIDVEVRGAVEVVNVAKDAPALGRLQVRDRILAINGRPVPTIEEVTPAMKSTPEGQPAMFKVRRGGKTVSVKITPEQVEGEPRVGIHINMGYLFPFDVSVNIPEEISGPSAGLVFSLAVYDTLTPGDLTGGGDIAGTGEIYPSGKVREIGGIGQKIAGARDEGAELFLVPSGNCPEADAVDAGDMRLAVVGTMHEAVEAIEAWVADPSADLPTCDDLRENSKEAG